jgi:hypothetical protein
MQALWAAAASSSVWRNLVSVDFLLPCVVGIVVAVFAVAYSEYREARRFSKLRVKQTTIRNLQIQGVTSRALVLPFANVSVHPAYELNAEITRISPLGTLPLEFTPIPLQWLYPGASPFERNVFRDQIAYLDIFHFRPPKQATPIFAVDVGMTTADLNSMVASSFEMKIDLYQRSGQRTQVFVECRWNTQTGQLDVHSVRQVLGKKSRLELTPKEEERQLRRSTAS